MQALNYKDDIKRQNKIASDWLINYRERKRAHEEKRQEIYSKREKATGLSTGLSKPTETIATNLIAHDFSNDAKWLEIVEVVGNMLGNNKRLLLRLRQECKVYTSLHGGRPGWIAQVQIRFGEESGWCPTERTLKAMWLDIINLTIRLALMKNLVLDMSKTP